MNKYEIIGIVGEGAYGIVYKAKNKDTGQFVAIKKFKESAEEDKIVKKTTKREVKMLNILKDRSVVKMIEAFKRKGRLYLVFEFMDKNLLEVLEEKPDGLDRESVKYFIYQLLKAVDYFHSQNIMHRDIKPENLLINSKTNELKVCDFGFARRIYQKNNLGRIHSSSNQSSSDDDESADEQSGQNPDLTDYVATRWYRSPELLLVSENLSYGKEVDIWAIGCILGELMDGQPLFPGDSEVDQLFVIQKVLGQLPDFLQEEFNQNARYQGLKFPEIINPETLEVRYAAVMNEVEIDLMKRMLMMDPRKRITARESIEHDWFDNLRKKDPEYAGEGDSNNSAQEGDKDSIGQIKGKNKRVLSPEMINQRQRQVGSTVYDQSKEKNNFNNVNNKTSQSHASHHAAAEPQRRSDQNYLNSQSKQKKNSQTKNQNIFQTTSQGQMPPNIKINSSQQNMMMILNQNENINYTNKSNFVVKDPLQNRINIQNGSISNQILNPNEQNYNYNIEGFGQGANENISIIASSDVVKGAGGFINSQNGKQIPNNSIYQNGIVQNNIRNSQYKNDQQFGGAGAHVAMDKKQKNQSQENNFQKDSKSIKALERQKFEQTQLKNLYYQEQYEMEQASLKAGKQRGYGAQSSGLSKGSQNESAINIQKKDNKQMNGPSTQDTVAPLAQSNNQRVGSINSNPGSTVSRGSKYNIHNFNTGQVTQNFYQIQNSQSPPSVRNKIQMQKAQKNSNSKGNGRKQNPNQYNMYQSNNLPITSQQSRRKSQVAINNMMMAQGLNPHNQQLGVEAMNLINFSQQMGMAVGLGIGLNNGVALQNFTGVSDTGAPPESSGTSMVNINMMNTANFGQMQMYQSNMNGSNLANYQLMNGMNNMNTGQNSQEKKKLKNGFQKSNLNNLRFNIHQNQMMHEQQYFNQNNYLPNGMIQQQNWQDEQNMNNQNIVGNQIISRGGHHSQGPNVHFKVGSKLKLGATTVTNFMKQMNNQPQQFNMSMLRSVQQNMPNMPSEYNYKIPAISSQSKIQNIGQSVSQGRGQNSQISNTANSIGAAYRGNTRKFVNANQIHIAADMQRNNNQMNANQLSNQINGARQQRAATQGGHIFGGQIGRNHLYGQIGSKLNKLQQNQQKFSEINANDNNSMSNGYLLINGQQSQVNGSPKFNVF